MMEVFSENTTFNRAWYTSIMGHPWKYEKGHFRTSKNKLHCVWYILNLQVVNTKYMNNVVKDVYDFKDASSKIGF